MRLCHDGPILARIGNEWERRIEVAAEMHCAAQVNGWRPTPKACHECNGVGWVTEYECGDAYAARCRCNPEVNR